MRANFPYFCSFNLVFPLYVGCYVVTFFFLTKFVIHVRNVR